MNPTNNQNQASQLFRMIHESMIPSGEIKPNHLSATPTQALGDLYYSDGGKFVRLPKGSNGQYLTLTAGIPAWGTGSAPINSYREQRDTTDSVVTAATQIAGWGVMQGAAAQLTETITFPITFTIPPIVIATWGGDSSSSGAYGAGGNNVKGLATCKAEAITTTTFDIRLRTTDGTAWGAGDFVFYQWCAFGPKA